MPIVGEIFDITVLNDSLPITVMHFDHTKLQAVHAKV